MQAAASGLPAVRGTEPRRLAAFVHADMVGYSRLIGQDDASTVFRLARLRQALIDPALARYGRKIANTAGDSLMMEFASVLSAVRFAVEIQTRIPEFDHDDPPDRRIRFRMGINIGDAISHDQNLHGDNLNIAARLQAICPPGGVCVSAVVRNHVQELDLQFEPLGKVELKNIARPVEAFVVNFDHQRHRPRVARKLWVAAAALAIVIASGAGWWVMQRIPAGKPLADEGVFSIAVLPFTNLGSDHADDYLGDGIAEDLTTDLSHLDGAVVVARESAFTYRGRQVDIREVGRQLGVRYVLEGSVRKFNETLRINAQLIAAGSGTHVWADRFDQSVRDLRDGQDSIVQRIGAALDIKFDKSKRQQISTADPDAYDLILRAKVVLQEPRSDVRNIIAAGYFERALRLNPASVEAQAGVASMIMETNRPIGRAAELIRKASLAAPHSPDVLGARFRLLIRQQRDEQAFETFRRLLDVDSSAAGLAAEFLQCVRCLGRWERPEDAFPLFERTARLNPLAPDRAMIYFMLGRMSIMLGRDSEAIEWLERALQVFRQKSPIEIAQREPGDNVLENTKLQLAAAYALADRLDDAHRMLASAMTWDRTMDDSVRNFVNNIPMYYDARRRAQEMRIADGLRLAGLRDHLDERAKSHVTPVADLQGNTNRPTPMTVPGAATIVTEDLVELLRSKPLVLTTSNQNPTVPGAILVNIPNAGNLSDEWQTALQVLVDKATNGNKQQPIVTFAWCINRWHARNLTLRLVALGYTKVYWYRGGWEAWDAHDLPKAPLAMQFAPPH